MVLIIHVMKNTTVVKSTTTPIAKGKNDLDRPANGTCWGNTSGCCELEEWTVAGRVDCKKKQVNCS
jgi:hypothetical protein